MRKSHKPGVYFLAFLLLLATFASADENELTEDSKPQAGVPKGKIEGPFDFNNSQIYPGTKRQYWIYVPAQYDASKPTCLFVLQDGLSRAKGWNVPTVLDNLIHKKEVPVQIGIFVQHGKVEPDKDDAQPRFNRSFEYDSMGDRYVTFLLDELLPEVAKKYNLSEHPDRRAIGGASSGAICAFTAAWERPDAFRRVLSTIGTYVGLRGGNEYPTLIRKSEPKPIRVFLQDGSNDLDIYGGGWWTANQSMLAALKWADYDVHHVWGEGGHSGKHAAAIMPDALRWLWRDFPEPIKARYGTKRRTDVLIESEGWQRVQGLTRWGTLRAPKGLASDKDGNVFMSDEEPGTIYRIDTSGQRTIFADKIKGAAGMDFDRKGNLLVCQGDQVTRIDPSGKTSTIPNFHGDDIVTIADGGFVIDRTNQFLWCFNNEGVFEQHVGRFPMPAGITATPDDAFLIAASYQDRFHVSFEIVHGERPSLRNQQDYGYIHTPPRSQYSTGGGMTVAADGRVYMATKLGVQIFDQLGRVHLILNSPSPGDDLHDVCFGGKDRDTLYVTAGENLYFRKLNTKGVGPHETVKPPKPGL